MNLSNFKATMTSDAMIERDKLKQQLNDIQKKYHKEVKELKEQVERLTEDCRALSNRCWVHTGFSIGTDIFCYNCELSEFKCEHGKTFDEKVEHNRLVHMFEVSDMEIDLKGMILNKRNRI